jgi:hypothetical protein
LLDPKLGYPVVERLFELFKNGKVSKEDCAFLKKCLRNLAFEVI